MPGLNSISRNCKIIRQFRNSRKGGFATLQTTPSARLRNGIFLLIAQPPLLGKEGNGAVSEPTPFPPFQRSDGRAAAGVVSKVAKRPLLSNRLQLRLD